MSKTETQSDEQKFSKEDLQMIEALGDQSLYGADAMEKRWSGETQSKALLYAELLERYLIQSEFAGDIAHGAAELLRRLDAENKAMRADAERYRWLREQNWHDSDLCVVRRPRQAIKPGYDCPSGERLDEFCDAAIAAQAAAKTGDAA